MEGIKLSKHEFFLDNAAYFADKKDLYFEIRDKISRILHVDPLEIKVCGSAYWGYRFSSGAAFSPGSSDLDIGIVSSTLFCRYMSEIRDLTKNFTDQTFFPQGQKSVSAFELFRDYAFKKGIINPSNTPLTDTRRLLDGASKAISAGYLDHFEKISFLIYDSLSAFSVKQAAAAQKFKGA
jgi:hypothetical protein